MTTPLPDRGPYDMLHTHTRIEQTGLPEGLRAELIGEEVPIPPRPTNHHNWIYAQLHRLLDGGTHDELVVTNTTTVALPATGERYVPGASVPVPPAVRHGGGRMGFPPVDVPVAK
ncbi:hypothetical protein [Streptomyces sp. SS8]